MVGKLYIKVIFVFLIIVNLLRFYKLDEIPHGYHIDEFAASISFQCLAEAGTGPFGNKDYIFLQQGFGTPKPPVYTYPAMWWSKLFNYHVEALRSFSVIAITFGIVGLFFLGRQMGGMSMGLWAMVAGAISPWSWVLGRLGWESFFAPVTLIWALYFFFKNKNLWDDLIAFFLFAVTCYYYPPARMFVPILIVGLIVYEWKLKQRKHYWMYGGMLFILSLLPLIYFQLKGSLSFRIQEVAIWNPSYLQTLSESNHYIALIKAFFINYFKHFSFDYLIFSGDPDFKHSTQRAGILSWLDLAMLCFFIYLIIKRFVMKIHDQGIKNDRVMLILFIGAYLVAIIPSGLTFLGTPNALRMCLAWPFLCLLTGYLASKLVQDKSWIGWVLSAIVLLNSIFFLNDYFNNYAKRSEGMFHYWLSDEAKTIRNDQEWLAFFVKHYNFDYHVRYYMMNDLHQGCTESFATWKGILKLVCQSHPDWPRCSSN